MIPLARGSLAPPVVVVWEEEVVVVERVDERVFAIGPLLCLLLLVGIPRDGVEERANDDGEEWKGDEQSKAKSKQGKEERKASSEFSTLMFPRPPCVFNGVDIT